MNKPFAIVVSQYNLSITEKLLEGAHAHLTQTGVPVEAIHVIKVPGAVEIPFTAQMLAKTHRYAAIICLGAVIRGETDHYDYVCQQVSYGCQKVMLDFNLPVIFGILTTDTESQALDRVGGKMGHKGIEAAETALTMLKIIETIGT